MIKKRVLRFLFLLLCGGPALTWGATVVTETFLLTVSPIDVLSVSGSPTPFNVAPSGTATSFSATNSSTSLSLTTNGSARKILVSRSVDPIFTNYSALSLSVSLATPPGVVSGGTVNLTTTPQPLATSISKMIASNLALTYTLKYDFTKMPIVPAGSVASIVVTFTLTQ